MPDTSPGWTRHLVYRSERIRTTWKLRAATVVLLGVTLWLAAGWIASAIGSGLICSASREPSDALLIDNFDPNYLLFERASELRAAGVAPLVVVPVKSDGGGRLNEVALGIADVMVRISRIGPVEFVAVGEVEPISLNAARDVRPFLEARGIRSIIVVTPLFRSRRSQLVYSRTLASAGISVRCEPVDQGLTSATWVRTWHGIQDVAEQWLKLQYYRGYVLRAR